MGVWIETFVLNPCIAIPRSHPSWVCGLKRWCKDRGISVTSVTPFVGVWIETNKEPRVGTPTVVTPFVGVWIETLEPF